MCASFNEDGEKASRLWSWKDHRYEELMASGRVQRRKAVQDDHQIAGGEKQAMD